MEEADRHRHVWSVGHVSNLPPQPPVSVAELRCQEEWESKLHFPQLSPELSVVSPTAIMAEAKVIEHEFCQILLIWLSRIVLLSEVALGIQCRRQDGDCAQTGSQDCVATTTTMQGESSSSHKT